MTDSSLWRRSRIIPAFLSIFLCTSVIPVQALSLGDVTPMASYIVVYKDSVINSATLTRTLSEKHHSMRVHDAYEQAFKGFSVEMNNQGELNALKNDPNVAFVTEDKVVQAFDLGKTTPKKTQKITPSVRFTSQWWWYPTYPTFPWYPVYPRYPTYPTYPTYPAPPSYPQPAPQPKPTPQPAPAPIPQPAPNQPGQPLPLGIQRIGAQPSVNKGTGIGVAILDTGIDLSHPDLAANILGGKNCINPNAAPQDDNGHGTHVAGTIGGLNNSIGVVGVAPEVKLIPVKILDAQGSGSWSSIICGIDWVTANAAQYNIKVVNMSLGGEGQTSDNNCGMSNNDALHQAICRARNAGITFVVAAGNSGVNASNTVPAAYNDAVITVSALVDTDGKSGGRGAQTSVGADDTFASFSNYGPVVDIAAPGTSIYSTWKGSSYKSESGTSMASPHVAGAAALYIKAHPGSSWAQVRDGLTMKAEVLGAGHSDPSGRHQEPVLRAVSF